MSEGVRWSYRPGSLLAIGVVGAVVLDAVLVWGAIDDVQHGRGGPAVLDLLWASAITAVVVEVFLRPRVATLDDGVLLVNPYRSVVVPWGLLTEVDAHLSLQLVTPARRFTSWAASGSRPTRRRRRRDRSEPAPSAGQDQGPNLAELLRTNKLSTLSGALQCKLFLDEAWQAWRTSPQRRGEAPPQGTPTLRWHWPSIAVGGALAVAVLVGSLLL
ncbi:MAG TPA: hypothetical protein VE781_09130 [Kineosporiaceae bacterium]|nr:hypothetical protein [Kineosporiaceae bacterium]